MSISIITQLLLVIAILATGIVYGTNVFFAIVGKKAAQLSKDSSIADVSGHTHLVADKRMPPVGISGMVSTIAFIVLKGFSHPSALLAACAFLCLLAHLVLYLIIAKPINAKMSAAAIKNITLPDIRHLQQKWDSIIYIRAVILTIAMVALIMACLNL
jgi:hypothetical protein